MIKYAQIIDDEKKKVSVGIGTDIEYYKSIGMTEMEVEEGYDGQWYVEGYAPSQPLDELKADKLAEIDAWTAAKITGGFISNATGAPVTYDSDKDTQLTVASDLNTINLAPDIFAEKFPDGYPMRGYPAGTDTSDKNNKVIYYLTKEQLLQWNVDIGLHRGACKRAGWTKQAEVAAAQSKKDLEAIGLD